MIEWLWAGLLALAVAHRDARALGLLLALKWASNYAAFRLIGEAAPAFIDVALGTVGIVWATRRRTWWSDVATAGFILTPLVHAWYWLPQRAGATPAVAYYALIVTLFTAQAAALAWPRLRERGRAVVHWRDSLRTAPPDAG